MSVRFYARQILEFPEDVWAQKINRVTRKRHKARVDTVVHCGAMRAQGRGSSRHFENAAVGPSERVSGPSGSSTGVRQTTQCNVLPEVLHNLDVGSIVGQIQWSHAILVSQFRIGSSSDEKLDDVQVVKQSCRM